VLTVKERLGLFEQPFVKDLTAYYTLTASDEHAAIALDTARKSMVLLQNYPDHETKADAEAVPVLPLDLARIKTLAVVGPNADQPQCGDYAAGGSWGGDVCGGGPINNNR
jgi:beta-glucosidase